MGSALGGFQRWHQHLVEKVERAGAGCPLNTAWWKGGYDFELNAMAQSVFFPLFVRQYATCQHHLVVHLAPFDQSAHILRDKPGYLLDHYCCYVVL
ncbi:hypothetical protein IGS59_20800 [Janthinobacterium sp. GW460P]|uniref:hypothetical protein n=1 Tax=unclassified Janthinobacterium TaxID=2610881 RepID=UPI00111C7421|nr:MULTISPECIES: hypothetical protein [unclassified Janthinobacterium]MCC7704685.1 hypothetical protein [Janthinobacterium sp. GW460P]MCC7710187.1 hypothetical protein [Janthinobacterium sp. GW460W]